MVWFPKQKVLHAGDPMFNGMMLRTLANEVLVF
jgi:hypothetical protein